jgi:hypothetical protein
MADAAALDTGFCYLIGSNVPLLFIIQFTVSDYSFGIFWALCCLSFDLRLLIILKKARENYVTVMMSLPVM